MMNDFTMSGNGHGYLAVSLSLVIRFMNVVAYSMISNYISELFPSKIRGFTLGFITTVARISNSIAPGIILLSDCL